MCTHTSTWPLKTCQNKSAGKYWNDESYIFTTRRKRHDVSIIIRRYFALYTYIIIYEFPEQKDTIATR